MNMTELDESLTRLVPNGWYATQPKALRLQLLEKAVSVRFAEGDWIYGATEEAGGLFCVLDGTIRLYGATTQSETLLLDLVGYGTWFGQVGVMREGRRMFTAVAAEAVTLLVVPRAALLQLLRANPAFMSSVMELDLVHVQYIVQFLSEVLALAPRERIAARLFALSSRVAPLAKIPRIPTTQSELAEMVGVERKTVNRILSEFEARGLIKRSYGFIEILKASALAAIRDNTQS